MTCDEDQGRTNILAALVAEMQLERRSSLRAMIGFLTLITCAVGVGLVFLGSRESAGIRAEAKVSAYSVQLEDVGRRLHSVERGWAFFLRRLDSGKIIIVDKETFDELKEMRNAEESELGKAPD